MLVSTTNNPHPNQNNQQQAVNIAEFNKRAVQSKKYPCPFENCKKSFSTEYLLNYHISIHLNPTKYSCDICNKNFSSQNTLKRHKKTHGDKKYTCDSCKISCLRRDALTAHNKTEKHKNKLKKITGTKHSCKICIQSFNTKKRLREHYSTNHESAKPYVCKICNKNYAFEIYLKKHLKKVHKVSTSKQINHYKCVLCHLPPFLNSKKLTTHYKQQHPGERPFACDFCDKGFLYLADKQKHNRNNHKDESLLKTSNQKTVSNNENPNTYQDNNQHKVFESIDDIMPDIAQGSSADDIILGTEQGSSANDNLLDIEKEFNEIIEQNLNEIIEQNLNEIIEQNLNEIIEQDLYGII